MSSSKTPNSDALVHYGVKGMKWGVRKANPDYNPSQRAYDKKNYGRGGVRRINKRMNRGSDLQKARVQERTFRARRNTAIGLGLLFGPEIAHGAKIAKQVVKLTAGVAAQSVAKRAETNRGRAAAAEAMGLPRMASTGPSYSRPNRKGVYNISSV